MKTDRVSYRETASFGQYQNATIEMSAAVEPGEDFMEAFERVKDCVRVQLAKRVEQHRATERESIASRQHDWQVAEKSRDLKEIEDRIERAREQWERARAFLVKHGLDPERIEDDIPF